MNIKILGKTHYNIGDTLRDVSIYLRNFISENGYGSSEVGSEFPVTNDEGKRVAVASYNGRMWSGKHNEPGRTELPLETPTPAVMAAPARRRAPKRTYYGEEAETVSAADQKVYDQRLRDMAAGKFDFDSILVERPSARQLEAKPCK